MHGSCSRFAVRVLIVVALSLSAQEGAAQPSPLPTGEAGRLDSLGNQRWSEYERLTRRSRMWSERDVSLIPIARGHQQGLYEDSVTALAEERMAFLPRNKKAAMMRRNSAPFDPPLGAGPYKSALQFYREAQALDSTNAVIERHVLRGFAAENEWKELLREGQRAARRRSGNADAWLAQGLAQHRMEKYALAAAAFDTAIALMPAARRAEFLSVTRLLVPNAYANRQALPDSLRYIKLPPAEQERIARRFWDRQDPRPGTPENEAKLEYFARVTYADMRYSPDRGGRGIDTDRGDIHVRFGPPEMIFGSSRGQTWIYRDNSIFFFGHGQNYLSTLISNTERRVVEDSILIEQPVGWTEMPLVRNTWPMIMRVARFRATSDSADAVVTAAVPVRSLLGDAELGGQLPIDVHLDVNDPRSAIVGAERRRVNVTRERLPVSINGTWVRRLSSGSNLVRIDAEQPDVGRGAVASADVTVDSLGDYGVSDILFGTMEASAMSASPKRWSDVKIAPTIGLFPTSQPMGVVWETYDLVPKDGSVNYTVTLSLERTFKKNIAGFSARIARNLLNVVTQSGSATGQIDVSFTETRPAAKINTNALTIDLAGSVTGPYRLRIEVKDLNSGRTVRRSADFQLVPDSTP